MSSSFDTRSGGIYPPSSLNTSDKERPEVPSSEAVYPGKLTHIVRDTVFAGEQTYVYSTSYSANSR
jgi:hypothetical protein